jgi:hypothetical protein
MTTPVDDLQVGQWVAIVSSHEEEHDHSPWAMFRSRPKEQVTGQPLKIVAMSLPFLAVTDGYRRFPIDVREVQVKKLDPKYVKAMKAKQRDYEPVGNSFAVPEPDKPKAESSGKHGLCPMCQSRLIKRKTDGDWFLACRECGFQGTLPKDHS